MLACAIATPPVAALPDDRDQPIRIEADEALRDEKQGFTRYEGNVKMDQGSLHIEADRITAGFKLAMAFFRALDQSGHPESVYHIINWNYMPPAGSSLIHPHLQVFATDFAPNLMRQELDAAKAYRAAGS